MPCANCGKKSLDKDRLRFLKLANEFLLTVTGGRCTADIYNKRKRICKSNKCGFLKKNKGNIFCGACGCPQWSMAELNNKLWFAKLRCPAGFFGRAAKAKKSK